MKVILNKDLSPLGEEGDIKEVAKGYARNFLFPRGIALPYNERTLSLFEGRREEIERRKIEKRGSAAELKDKLESLTLSLSMPAGPTGKLYGAVTSQTVVDELAKQGYQIERKRIELPAANIKNVGKYKLTVKLYENASAELALEVLGLEIKTETRKAPAARPPRRGRDIPREEPAIAAMAAEPPTATEPPPAAVEPPATEPEGSDAGPAEG
jgi:large subunit ribosomal protein L9